MPLLKIQIPRVQKQKKFWLYGFGKHFSNNFICFRCQKSLTILMAYIDRQSGIVLLSNKTVLQNPSNIKLNNVYEVFNIVWCPKLVFFCLSIY